MASLEAAVGEMTRSERVAAREAAEAVKRARSAERARESRPMAEEEYRRVLLERPAKDAAYRHAKIVVDRQAWVRRHREWQEAQVESAEWWAREKRERALRKAGAASYETIMDALRKTQVRQVVLGPPPPPLRYSTTPWLGPPRYAAEDVTTAVEQFVQLGGQSVPVSAVEGMPRDADAVVELCPGQGACYCHGTSAQAAFLICAFGFAPSKGGLLGPGVYLGGLAKATAYCKGWLVDRRLEAYVPDELVALGPAVLTCGVEFAAEDARVEAGPSSIAWGGKLNHGEICVRDPSRVRVISVHLWGA